MSDDVALPSCCRDQVDVRVAAMLANPGERGFGISLGQASGPSTVGKSAPGYISPNGQAR